MFKLIYKKAVILIVLYIIYLCGNFIYYAPSNLLELVYHRKDKPIFLIIYPKNWLGEREVAARLEKAGNNLAMNSLSFPVSKGITSKILVQILNYALKPELIFNLDARRSIKIYDEHGKYYGINNIPTEQLFQENGSLLEDYQVYDGIISAPIIKFEQIPNDGKIYLNNYYSSFYRTEYHPLKYNYILYCGGNWDSLRRGPERQKLYQYLDQEIPIKFYGSKNAWKNVKHYEGLIAFDGLSFAQKIREAGIVLMLHAETHLNLQIPTARIFDATANGAIAISDEHKFIRENFGDYVLYIDTSKSAREIADQIKHHYAWIKANPDKADEMARNAHKIFLEKFTLENLIIRALKAQASKAG